MRALLTTALLTCALGCGLVPPDPIGFRAYPLRDVSYPEAVEIVQDVTREFLLERFGGVAIAWDEDAANLAIDPIIDGQRRLQLYVHVEEVAGGVDVEMFALVTHLEPGTDPTALWTRPMQDVPLEEMLHRDMVSAVRSRRDG